MDWPSTIIGAVIGAAVVALVDTDRAVIWAGAPPWVGLSYYFANGLPDGDPPEIGFDWSQ